MMPLPYLSWWVIGVLPVLSWGMCVPSDSPTDDAIFTMHTQQTLTIQGLNCQAEDGQGERYHVYRWRWQQQGKIMGEGFVPVTPTRADNKPIRIQALNTQIIAIDEQQEHSGRLLWLYWATSNKPQVYALPYTRHAKDNVCSQAPTPDKVDIRRCRQNQMFGQTLHLRAHRHGWQVLNPAALTAFTQ